MKKNIFIARGHREAELHGIAQQIAMSPSQRQRAAKAIKRRIYGPRPPDIRSARQVEISKIR